jgi:ABC-type phosphate transport system auxiliary subunit
MAELEERMTRIEGMLIQIDKRLTEWINHFDTEIRGLRSELRTELGGLRTELHTEIGGLRSELRTEIGGLRVELGGLRAEQSRNFRWTLGILLGILLPMWVTIILAILLKGR